MERRERVYQKINPYFMVFYCLTNIGLGIYNIFLARPYFYLIAFAAPLFLLIPFLLRKIFGLQPVHELNFLIYLFCYLLYTIGLVIQGYTYIPYYDKFAHTLSGVFITLVAMGLFYLLKHNPKKESSDFPLLSVFSVAVSIAIAGLWEIAEYLMSLLFHMDPQNVLTTGVGDTIQDMIVCTIGSLLLVVSMYFYFKKGKTSWLMGVFDAFYYKNLEKAPIKAKNEVIRS